MAGWEGEGLQVGKKMGFVILFGSLSAGPVNDPTFTSLGLT